MSEIPRYEKIKGRAFLFILGSTSVIYLASIFVRPPTSQSLTLEKPPLTKKLFLKGEQLYQKQCSMCHGVQGGGDGKAAYLLYPKPRDFTRGEFRLVSTTEMTVTNEDLFKAITRGMPGSAMPPWEFLNGKERWALVYYIRYLSELGTKVRRGEITEEMIQRGIPWETQKQLATENIDPASVIKVPPESAVTNEGLVRGRELFVKACAPCHGPQGRGDGQQVMADSLGYPLKPRDLTAGIFKGASSSEELYYRIAAGLPGSPMPSYGAALTQEQIWDLIHYVQTLPKPGAEERARLHRSKIVAYRLDGALDLNPLSDPWQKTEPVFISLTPLWWRNERVEGVEVRALHDGAKIAIHLSWEDATKDTSAVAIQSFPDGAAIQFAQGPDPPTFAMGSAENPVTIWNWKASWQEEIKEWPDIETVYPDTATDWYESQRNYKYGDPFETKDSKTKFHDPNFLTGWGRGNLFSNVERKSASEEAMAKGFGSLTTQGPKIEPIEANGVWKEGKWQVVFSRPLKTQEKQTLEFEAGRSLHIGFAVWDGSKQDRDGQKMISVWNELVLEK